MARVRIAVADDHTIVRHGLRRILQETPEWEVIAEAANGREAVMMVCEQRPDVAIFDIGMTLLNGIEATRQVMRRLPLMRVLILSMHAERSYVDAALRAGARGYLLKDSMDCDLVKAVDHLSHGRPFFSPEVAAHMLDGYTWNDRPAGDPFDSLSEREREIVQLIAEARTSKEIASLLSISVGTVETHRARIFAKLDIHSTAALVLYAVRKGVVS
jgi:two-component system, NarL family, response regulator NreC